ncbi:probable E3 ubiquitin-protein ligase HERC6 isoform X1 [Lepisosteus oculatus]|uniref:probable E3 ubiquitin-protein ligase HERC6 isoform X1 n=1 Tax=Lepisosteus oculatus TaxID=7918 RepID=UPI0035F52DA4
MYCWGEGTSGQLGLDLQENDSLVLQPAEVHPLLRHVSLVACGEQHTLFLNEEGNVLSCGSNHRGQLGRQSSLGTKTPAPVQGPTGVVSVACGQEHSLALCQSGQVYSWGRGSEGQLGTGAFKSGVLKPRIIQSLGQIQIFQVACGNHHTLALSRGGAVFSWGQNSLGQLGLGKGTPSQPVPTQVLSLSGVPVSQIAAGGAHSFALSLSGAVYCWGANNAGQLGINRVDEKGRFSPCPAVALKLIGVSYISCGDAHTAVLSKDGGVYTFGDGRHGQLGHNSTTNEFKPRRVEQITEQASQVACGSHHTLVYLSSPGLLLAFGSGSKGQLGNNSTASHLQPTPVQQPWSSKLTGSAQEGHLNPKEIAVFTGKNTNFIQIQPSKCPVTKGELLKIDQERIKKWLTVEFGSKQWKEAKSEIAEICSSASCLIASFLKKWDDSPSENRMHFFGVDIESARGTFRQLQKKHWIINQITTSFMDKLIPSLQSPSPNVEALEIFLILPEVSVFHEEKHIRDLILPLSSAMANLNDTSIKILRNWWSTLQATHLNKILQMFKYALSCMLKSAMRTHEDHQLLKKVLHNMKQLFKANKGAKFRLPVSAFYIDEVVPFVPVVVDMVNWRFYAKLDMDDICPVIFCRFPFALTLLAKVQMLHVDTRLKSLGNIDYSNTAVVIEVIQRAPLLPPLPVFRLQVRRTQLTADAFRKLHMAEDATFREQLMVEFQEKQCQDQRGIQREFFCRVISEIIEPESGMFWYNESSTVIWFPTKASVEKKKYYLFGILCGLAVYNYNTVHLPFPLALFKKLVDVKPTLEDLKELEPRVGESLQDLLDYSGDDIEERLALSFSVCWDNKEVDLIPDGKSKPVNKSNRKEFVSAYVDYVFNKAVNGLFDEFRRGFCKVCDAELLSFFQPQELMEAMTGTTDYDWNKFKRNALYKGSYHADHPTVIIFWKVFLDLTLDQKKDFLMFLTGSDRIPVLGIEYVKVTIVPLPSSTEDHYPEANVCFLHLLLPDYTTEKRLRERLLQAFSHSRGSWKV